LKFLFPLALMVVVSSLTGCATLFHQSPPTANTSSNTLANLQDWHLEGRLGVQSPAEAWQARIVWHHEINQDRVLVLGPLNQGMLSIVLRKGVIYLNEGRGGQVSSHEPEAVLQERLGFPVPLYSLRHWILGLPDPARASTSQPDSGGASVFGQAGWTVESSDHRISDGYRIPGKLKIQGGEVKLKLVIDQWKTRVQP